MISIISIITGLIGLFLNGLYCIAIALITVFLSIIAKKRKEKFYLIGMILGVIGVIFVNLQNMGIIRSNLELKSLYKMINITNQGFEKLVNENDKEILLKNLNIAYKIGKKIKVEKIEKKIPNFTKHFKEEYLKGLKFIIDGYKNKSQITKVTGVALIERWSIWYNKNNPLFKKAFQEKDSFFEFIKSVFSN